jgi:quercetin dioxygenase-like cupin family protein
MICNVEITAMPAQHRFRIDPALKRALVLELALAPTLGGTSVSADTPKAGADRPVAEPLFSQKLTDLPGKTLSASRVTFPPGRVGAPHRHGGPLYGYVLSGTLRTLLEGQPVTVYRAGESFFEPAGAHHVLSQSDDPGEPVQVLAILIADEDAAPTTYDP